MAIRLAQEFVARTAVNPQSYLIGHRTAGHEDRPFFSQQFGGPLLQSHNSRVDVDYVVTH
jgi:hypothetical protein